MKFKTLTEKLDLIQWLSSIEDESIIEKLLEFRRKETTDWWEQISDEEKASINKGIKEADNKELKSHSEARKIYAKWL
ncbi:MAG TPA: hypothetical protein VK021_07415 [Flavobacteriaceae bacterium]|nr:hypothetical protein [Flavobacteriaceae bacterium]